MLGQMIGIGALSLAGAALAVPASRRVLLGDVRHDWLQGELEFDRIDRDGETVRLKSGMVMRAIAIRGAAYDAMVDGAQANMLQRRAGVLSQLGDLGATIRLIGVKRRRDFSFAGEWPSASLTRIGEAERAQFTNIYYVCWFAVIEAETYGRLIEAENKFLSALSDYGTVVLRRAEAPDSPCPLTSFLHFLVSGDLRDDLPAISSMLSGALPGADFTLDRANGAISTRLPGLHHHRVLAVRGWPESVSGRIMAEILALEGDMEVMQICVPTNREMVLGLMKRKRQEYAAGIFGNPIAADQLGGLMDIVSEGKHSLFETQFQITVRAGSESDLDDLLERIARVLGLWRVLYNVETEGAAVAWFNRLPGNNNLIRPLKLLDQNIAALWPFQSSPPGRTKSPYGDRPVRLFRTPSAQSFSFQFHLPSGNPPTGNYLVFAPSGGGKSTLMMHLLGGLTKFAGVRSYFFDSNEGARFMIESMGGVYRGYDDLELNPLDVGGESESSRQRINMILRALFGRDAGESGGGEEDDDEEAMIKHAIDLCFTVDPPDRTLNAIFDFAFTKRTRLRRGLARWVTDQAGTRGLHAHIFNAPHDTLGGFLDQSFLVGINMNEALSDPVIGPPVVAHIAAAIKEAAMRNEAGFNIFIDEGANLLQNEGFRAVVMEMFREYRKLGGAVGIAFQDPAALHRSGIAEAVIENTATMIFFPNALATRKSLEAFNLNDEQLAFVTGGGLVGGRGRPVLVVQRDGATGFDESVIIDVDLSPLGDALKFYRAGAAANRELAALKTQHGDDWRLHL